MKTVRVKPAPVILLVGCAPAFVRRCNEAAVQGRAIAIEADLATFATMATQTRARGVLMPREIYAPNAALFDAMASTAGTRVLTFATELIEHEALLALILSAVDGAEDNDPEAPAR